MVSFRNSTGSLADCRTTPPKRRTCYEFHMGNMAESLRIAREDMDFDPKVIALYLLDLRAYRTNCRNMSADQLTQFDERLRKLEQTISSYSS